MTEEDLKRLDQGKKILTRIHKAQALIDTLSDYSIEPIFTNKKTGRRTTLDGLLGGKIEDNDEIRDKIIGDIKLFIRAEIADLKEEFDKL